MTTTREKLIQDYLLADEISPHYLGFYYLVDAIDLFQPGISLTNCLYIEVAARRRTTATRVERAMRHALEMAGLDMTNGEYIARAALIINREEGCA